MAKMTDENDNLVDVKELQTGLPVDADIPAAPLNEEPVAEDKEGVAPASKPAIDPEMMAMIKSQIMAELATEQEKKVALAAEERRKAAEERAKYVEKMKASKEPWVDVIGNVTDGQGVGIELDWNDAFVDFLRAEGINGTDDNEVVQKYITLLLRDMADTMEEEREGNSEFAG